MSDDVLIRCENVSKIFCRDLKRSLWYGVQDIAGDLFQRSKKMPSISAEVELRDGEFWANKDISFEVKRGECLGLIGRNGAGKTTLLKMLNGLIKPDTGRIELIGQVGALIALGAGFNPVLTGRENIYVNASILGLSKKQIRDRIDEIVEFAELSDFVDSPVRSYSSGMYVKLGFAIAAVLVKPDILLLDEVLAVGDIGFVIKCLNAIQDHCNKSAVVFVSHNMQYVARFCSHGLLMKSGQAGEKMGAIEAIGLYNRQFEVTGTLSGSGLGEVHRSHLVVDGVELPENVEIQHGSSVELVVDLSVAPECPTAVVRLGILDRLKLIVAKDIVGHNVDQPYRVISGRHRIKFSLGKLEMSHGAYAFIVVIENDSNRELIHRSDANAPFYLEGSSLAWGNLYAVRAGQNSEFVNGKLQFDANDPNYWRLWSNVSRRCPVFKTLSAIQKLSHHWH